MTYWFLMSGAAISLIGAIIHGLVGGRIYLGNINSSSMTDLTKSLSLVAWHVFTLFLLVSALTLAITAHRPELASAVYPIIGVNLLGCLLFLFLGSAGHAHLLKMPGAYLMGSVALLGWMGIS